MSIVRKSFFAGVSDPYMTNYVWDPFAGVEGVASVPTPYHPTSSVDRTRLDTRIEWKDTPEAHVYKVNLPGFCKNDVKVKLNGNMLCITGEKHIEKEVETGMGYRVERSSRMFSKGFELPPDAKGSKIWTCFENEVLTVTVPKDERKRQTRFIEIH